MDLDFFLYRKLVYKSRFMILQSLRLKMDKHWTSMSQDLHVDIVTVCFGGKAQLRSVCLFKQSWMCLYMAVQRQRAYERSRQESVGSSHFSHPLPPGSGYTEGPQLSPQHIVRILLFIKTAKSLWTVILMGLQEYNGWHFEVGTRWSVCVSLYQNIES